MKTPPERCQLKGIWLYLRWERRGHGARLYHELRFWRVETATATGEGLLELVDFGWFCQVKQLETSLIIAFLMSVEAGASCKMPRLSLERGSESELDARNGAPSTECWLRRASGGRLAGCIGRI